MKKLKKMFEEIKINKNAKKHGRTFEQQEYRDKLAKTLKELKKEGKSVQELDKILSKKQGTIEYAENQISCGRILNGDLAEKLIDSGNLDFVVRNLNKFKGLGKNIAEILLDEGYYRDVAGNIMSFEGLDKTIIEKFLINGNRLYLWHIENLQKFEGLDEELAWKLIENHCGRLVARNLDKFIGLNRKEVGEALISCGCVYYVAENLEKFEGFDHNEVAKKLLNRGEGYHLCMCLGKFKGLDDEVAWRLITGYPQGCRGVAQNLKSFEGLSNETAKLMIRKVLGELSDYEMGEYLENNLKSFKGLSSDTIESIHRLAHPRYVSVGCVYDYYDY